MCACVFNAEDLLLCPDSPVMKPLSYRGYEIAPD